MFIMVVRAQTALVAASLQAACCGKLPAACGPISAKRHTTKHTTVSCRWCSHPTIYGSRRCKMEPTRRTVISHRTPLTPAPSTPNTEAVGESLVAGYWGGLSCIACVFTYPLDIITHTADGMVRCPTIPRTIGEDLVYVPLILPESGATLKRVVDKLRSHMIYRQGLVPEIGRRFRGPITLEG